MPEHTEAERRKKKLVSKTDRALEGLGEGRGTSKTNDPAPAAAPPPKPAAPAVEKRGVGRNTALEVGRRNAADLKGQLDAARKAGNKIREGKLAARLAAVQVQNKELSSE